MPPGGCKHLRWDYHAATQAVYVCGGDWNSPFFTSGGGDYNTVVFKYTGSGNWSRDYPQHLGAALYDCNIGPAGDFQPPPHCEASFSWAGGNKFISADYRTDWNTEGPFPNAWTTGVSRPTIGFATMTQATQPMEYDIVTRKWSKRANVQHIGQAQLSEMATFDPTRNLWIRLVANQSVHTTHTVTGEEFQFNNCAFPNHPNDGRTPTNWSFYRPVIVGTKCFMYNPNPWPSGAVVGQPWPVYIWYFNLADLDNHTPGFHLPIYWFCQLWENAVPPVVASEQDMVFVPTENALLIWGDSAMTNVGNAIFNFTPNPKSNPESYFVDVDTGAKRPGPPLPRGRNGAVYRPNNTIYYPPTDEIVVHGNTVFRDPYLYPSSVSSQNAVEESRQYTIYKRGANLPAWAAALPLFQWYAIPNSSIRDADRAGLPPESAIGSPNNKIDDWNGLAFRKRGSYLYSAANGGHTDYGGNEVDCFCLNTDTPRWLAMKAQAANVPTMFSGFTGSHYADGSPAARHTYHSSHYIESFNRIFLLGRASTWPKNTTGVESDAYDLDTNTWLPAGSVPNLYGGPNDKCQAQHPDTDDVFIIQHGGTGATPGLAKFSATTGQLTQIDSGALTGVAGAACVIDPVRNRMVVLHSGFGNMVVDLSNAAVTPINLSGPAAGLLDFSPRSFSAQHIFGLAYDAANDCYFAKPSARGLLGPSIDNKLVRINPVTFDCTEVGVTVAGGGSIRYAPNETLYTRFRYVPEMKGLVYVPTCNSPSGVGMAVYFMRTA